MTLRSLPIALIVLAAGVLGAQPAHAQDVTVPDVVGLPVDQARGLLEQAGFSAEVETVPGRPIGQVFSQEPGGLATRSKGSAVRLMVRGPTAKVGPAPTRPPSVPPVQPDRPAGGPPDLGPPPTGMPPTGPLPTQPPSAPATPGGRPPAVPDRPPTLPDLPPTGAPLTLNGTEIPAGSLPSTQGPEVPSVLGQDLQQAQATLRGWRVGVEYTLGIDSLAGKVVNQWPFAGSSLAQNEDVTVVVAVAEAPSSAHRGVPQVEETDWRAALDSLTRAGFRPQPVSVPSRSEQHGRVLAQKPMPGSLALPGSAVRLWVGRGQPGLSRPTRPPVLPPTQPPTQPPAQPPLQPLPADPGPTPPVGGLTAPALLGPPDGDSYPFRFGADFSWSAVSGASAYEWELEEELPSRAWQKVDTRMVSATRYRPQRMERGRFRWRVRAVHQAMQGAWSEYRRIYMY